MSGTTLRPSERPRAGGHPGRPHAGPQRRPTARRSHSTSVRTETAAEYFYDYAGQDPINNYDLAGTEPERPGWVGPYASPFDDTPRGGIIRAAELQRYADRGGARNVVGSSRMQLDIGEPGNPLNSRTTIGGIRFSGHAIDRLQGRGIPPSVVRDTIETGASSLGKTFSTRVYYSKANNVTVVRNWITRRVVTVRYGRP